MKKIHFIGICGAGMSAVAMMLKDLGWEVTGSDGSFYPPVSTYLENSGIRFFKGYRRENIPAGAEMFVIGKHAKLTPHENEEVRAAFETGLPIKSFAEVLGELSKDKENIVVAGSHGKSTCAALLAWCLKRAGKNPSYFIGAIPATPGKSSNVGRGNLFVLEGDEYPASNWDARSKFLHYRPAHVLLTSLAHDHLNVFKTVADYRAPFKKLINLLPASSIIAACADGDGVRETLADLNREATLYGLNEKAGWHIENPAYSEISSFDIANQNKKIVRIETELLGTHNMENILGAAALLFTLNLVTPEQFAQAVAGFQPIQRRLDKKSEKTRIPVYEGFGSSGDKARAAISAIRTHYPNRKLMVLFEPHAFSWRDRQSLPWYDDVFAGTDKVLIYKPPENSTDQKQLSLDEIVERVRGANIDAAGFESAAIGLEFLDQSLDENCAVLILSSGGFDGIIEGAVNLLEQKFQNQR